MSQKELSVLLKAVVAVLAVFLAAVLVFFVPMLGRNVADYYAGNPLKEAVFGYAVPGIVALSSLRVDLSALIGGQTTTDPIRIQTRIQAGCLLTILPMFLLYILAQRKLADSIEHMGIK